MPTAIIVIVFATLYVWIAADVRSQGVTSLSRAVSLVTGIQWAGSRIFVLGPLLVASRTLTRQDYSPVHYRHRRAGRVMAHPVDTCMSASLIGRLGSSAFRLSTTAMSMSLTGSCFSSESTPGSFHHGIRGRGGTIFWAALPSIEWQVQADMRTHLIHRPARDIFPPLGGARVFSYRVLS